MIKGRLTISGLIIVSLLTQLAVVASSEDQERGFVRIDFEKVKMLEPVSLTVNITFTNHTYIRSFSLRANQSTQTSATFSTNIQEGPFTITLTNEVTNATVLEVDGELTREGATIQTVYDTSLLQILPEDNSITISVGAVSANFVLVALASEHANYAISFNVQNLSRSILVEGDEIHTAILITNMPPIVNFAADVKAPDNSTVLASISGTLDFVKGVGLEVRSSYNEPITFINLTVERIKSVAICQIPNTQIVKIPTQAIPLTQPTDPVTFAFGTPKSTTEESNIIQTSTEPESDENQDRQNAERLIDFKPIYDLFSDNLAKILVSVLVLFSAVAIAKRVIG